jgi:signal transduction histidine kinase
LAGGIAHRVNNLMTAVLGNAELLKIDPMDYGETMTRLDTICQSARQAGDLAEQLVAFAQGGKYQPRRMDLNMVAQGVLHAQERDWPSRVQVKLDLDPDAWQVNADLAQMSQVVLHLLTNAVEALEDGGRITVATRNVQIRPGVYADVEPGPYLCLSMQDTGCGMDAEVQARVFEPFFTTKFQGRGMGLAAVYGIVKNHGGHISVHSEVGRGTTFTVYLPAVQ